MPATLNEAYMTPFHNFTRGTQSSSSNTADIRAALPMTAQSQPATGHAFAMPTDFRIKKDDSEDEMQSIYNSLREPSIPQASINEQMRMPAGSHDCNELISRIMSCPSCREKLVRILAHEERPRTREEEKKQTGGASFLHEGLWPVISNFLIGLAVIVLIDKIVKLRIKT